MKILILLIFKNSQKWIYRFFDCIEYLLQSSQSFQDPQIQFSLSVIYGDDTDGTNEILIDKLDQIKSNYGINIVPKLISFPKSNRLDGIQRLVVLRNAFIYINDNFKNYDYVLSIDTDIIFDSNTIFKLIKDIQNPRLDNPGIIAPMVFIENFYTYMNSYFYDTFAFRIQDKMFSHIRPYVPIPISISPDQLKTVKTIINVDSVGSLYLAKSDIFTKYDIKYGTYLRKIDLNTQHPQRKYESEQVFFCENVKTKTPYNIYVDLNTKVYHINLQRYGMTWH